MGSSSKARGSVKVYECRRCLKEEGLNLVYTKTAKKKNQVSILIQKSEKIIFILKLSI